MSKQIAVRLPDELVEFIDKLVQRGSASSRAAYVTRALERERRRDVAARDAAILAQAARTLTSTASRARRAHPAGRPRLMRPIHTARLDRAARC